jgi:hypothetical protein
MQTSALRQHLGLDIELSGMLTADAEIRTRIETGGRTSVVLRLHLEHQHNQAVQHIVVDKTFNEMQYAQAAQEAKQYTKGRCITFESTPADMRIVFPNVSKITVL